MVGATPLLLACGQGNYNIIRILLGAGANAKQTSTGQYGVLHWFASNTRDASECVELLIAEGIPADQPALGEMVTPLMMAAANGLFNTVVVLLHHGADPTLQDSYGRNAIAYARMFDDYDVVDKMITEMCKRK